MTGSKNTDGWFDNAESAVDIFSILNIEKSNSYPFLFFQRLQKLVVSGFDARRKEIE